MTHELPVYASHFCPETCKRIDAQRSLNFGAELNFGAGTAFAQAFGCSWGLETHHAASKELRFLFHSESATD